MLAKVKFYVCPVPGCASISGTAKSCSRHPNRAMRQEVYIHQRNFLNEKLAGADQQTREAMKKLFGDQLHG